MLVSNNKVLKINNKWLNTSDPYNIQGVVIGTKIWSKPNLMIDDGEEGIYYVDNVTIDGVNYGRQYYYNWYAAVRVAAKVGNGWRLPTTTDWYSLATDIGGWDQGNKLKSTTGWYKSTTGEYFNGTDDYGLTIYPFHNHGSLGYGVTAEYHASNRPGDEMSRPGIYDVLFQISSTWGPPGRAYSMDPNRDIRDTSYKQIRLVKDVVQ